MYTMGRLREKAMTARNPFYVPQLLTHFAIIDAYHDWNDGKDTPAQCLDRVFRSLGNRPGKSVLETAGYWFRRAARKEPAFVEYVRRLGDHKSALARLYSLWGMPEPQDWGLALVSKLANDRSRRVRRAVLNRAAAGRWLSVIPILREAQVLRQDDPAELDNTISLIANGYFEEPDGGLRFYCGSGPGGVGVDKGVYAKDAAKTLEILTRLSVEENEYRRIHGEWRKRPKDGHCNLEALRNWSPLQGV